MARANSRGLTLLALLLTLAIHSAGRADAPRKEPEILNRVDDHTSKIYSLSDLGDDPHLGKWIVETIPAVIQPGTWHKHGAAKKCVLSYYAPKRILVVYHSPAVHAEVDAFLKNLKTAMPTTAAAKNQGLVQAQYSQPSLLKTGDSTPPTNYGYPVPAQATQPKHLFHFIIRYEGEGIIDTNVADLFKTIYSGAKDGDSKGDPLLGSITPETVVVPGRGVVELKPPGTKKVEEEEGSEFENPAPLPRQVEPIEPTPPVKEEAIPMPRRTLKKTSPFDWRNSLVYPLGLPSWLEKRK